MNFTLTETFSYELPYKKHRELIQKIEDELNFYLDKNYGDKLTKIYGGIICVSSKFEGVIFPRPPKLLRKQPALEFEYKLDFETYKVMTDDECKKYIAVEYFNNIQQVFVIKKIKDFDSVTFLKDLEAFFKGEGLL